jgi:NADP-dependent 3-hydroxy acid dehydrogenase YdfG
MSIIERSNPINLQYRVAVVTSASTPLGVIICKTLLKANAFVVGIDSRRKDHSLNAGEGTHFQFVERDVNNKDVPEAVIELARKTFYGKSANVLVNVVEEGKEGDLDGLKRLTQAIGEVMQREKEGCIVNVLGAVDGVEESKSQPIVRPFVLIKELRKYDY